MNVDDTDYDSPSLSSSRSPSPTPSFDDYAVPGNKAMDLYDTMLPKWRAAPRRWLIPLIRKESQILAKMQEKIRTPWLDAYFVYTSSLGTHTFFMTTLPACFWFGYTDLARGLLSALSIGVYCSSVVKDLFCSPRPFSPPVTRLTMGSHHLEYGFPSTHSTNSISIALLLFAYIYDLTYPPLSSTPTTLSPTTFIILSVILAIYAFSIVFGRLYTAMHSFTDCFCGVFLGTAIWWVSSSWNGIPIRISSLNILSSSPTTTIHLGRGLGMETHLWNWVSNGHWEVPVLLIPLCLFLVHQHPQPVDDCPCFEDAIAFASVFFGALVGDWVKRHSALKEVMERVAIMPGSGWIFDVGRGWIQVERGWLDYLTWWSAATLKMTIGIMVIFTWRLLAKSALHLILPPLFRLCARAFRLPNRRFYTPATEYKSVPSEFAMTKQGVGVLHPIPSLIDLPGSVGFDVEVDMDIGERKGKRVRIVNGGVFNGNEKIGKVVNVGGNGGGLHVTFDHDEEEDNKGQGVKHYDADVLTKVIVYAGIAFISIEVLPASFGLLGLGVKSWM
ncbi:hypothetical protein AGABI1DRAFT_78483 [Agaricus bisporus var. burnettii JB137-S8]|uniref:Phosphatidic acid phosphatase type 2/haloperoxidase domain-containing protein n=1 Tax=Agaricus bisporus var. burnettii (strain JB137-S8 / ATCC MYA-4627 / FGSC 10392) TaxID=597362 RepID=K5VPL8_AGABU|nr:uncharacterized protein AGABI1DRAFT_78483 [Agaricus bisporus var. burnettii JB137-S8]EKM76419.1 hypothetical protein AGABI1DRAFT_78483 [Agaricus bisporus var. burnettii JB137-S8]